MLEERRDIWLPVADERGVDRVVDDGPVLRGLATPDRLSQVLDNLIDNALEVSPEGSVILSLIHISEPTRPY